MIYENMWLLFHIEFAHKKLEQIKFYFENFCMTLAIEGNTENINSSPLVYFIIAMQQFTLFSHSDPLSVTL